MRANEEGKDGVHVNRDAAGIVETVVAQTRTSLLERPFRLHSLPAASRVLERADTMSGHILPLALGVILKLNN